MQEKPIHNKYNGNKNTKNKNKHLLKQKQQALHFSYSACVLFVII